MIRGLCSVQRVVSASLVSIGFVAMGSNRVRAIVARLKSYQLC